MTSIKTVNYLAGLGVGVATVTPNSGIITGRVGIGFTDMNFIGTGITVTGYGSTVVVDMSSIAAASAGASGDDALVFAIAFGTNINTFNRYGCPRSIKDGE